MNISFFFLSTRYFVCVFTFFQMFRFAAFMCLYLMICFFYLLLCFLFFIVKFTYAYGLEHEVDYRKRRVPCVVELAMTYQDSHQQ